MATTYLKAFFVDTYLYRTIRQYRQRRRYEKWLAAGKPIPPPHLAKQLVIKDYAARFNPRILVETGTYLGHMLWAVQDLFAQIYSIELSEKLHAKSQARFAGKPHITLLHGDSAELLPALISRIAEPCLFWLDGHYSGGITAKGAVETPIEKELLAILGHPVKGHVILIDDAHCFTGEHDYPTLEYLQRLVEAESPRRTFAVEDDIIRISAVRRC